MRTPQYYWHAFHEHLLGTLDDGMAYRRSEIREAKPAVEQPLRLRLFRRAKLTPELSQLLKDAGFPWRIPYTYIGRRYRRKLYPIVNALHKEQCPRCPWNGRTIFTRKRKSGEWY